MRIAYIGDKEETRVFGLVFPRGVGVEVEDEKAASKLSRNPDFAQEFEGVQVLEPVQEPARKRGRPPKSK